MSSATGNPLSLASASAHLQSETLEAAKSASASVQALSPTCGKSWTGHPSHCYMVKIDLHMCRSEAP